ncbi:MAG: polyisoprenoid-binding protein [Betaproteobacteria bacterium CG2_30_59_46]|nr:MAG: polyisoprenoid-binding protein [Betaproteobacteria bacterium CG2_30_59_46]PIQ11007.1 MAG: polyisoprenoid-binding protein [Hydrogenophilales bacterium CG18_big_fil_WC_8_21_14_2_50_58_12]PIX99829.1 MAG: polyisoprenoid-binding protein [Hydrogenophilales bacterium CG_4_10_14_3_um_filter_58_23]PJB04372.1 MAG: polyisoprenoid-binding protein [Hydrogenophilales bacterium CG_4_9_14_3_um_filter_59_35]
MTRLFAALALLVAVSPHAAELSAVQLDKSSIAFVSRQMNVPVEGVFKKFSAQISIDPAKPEAGRARIEIDLNNIDAGSTEANDELKSKNWFNTREFPRASFVSSAVKALGGGRFEAFGKTTLKGKTLESRAPFTLKQEKGVLILDGTFPLKRLAYGIGSGAWSDTSVVADEVLVKFHFVLK